MKRTIKILGLFIFTMFMYVTCSNAAISASSTTVNSGEEATISVTSDVAVGSYSVTLTDLGGTTFVTSSGGTGAGTQTITDAKNEGMTRLATFKVKVPEVTSDTTYLVVFSATAMEDTDLNAVADSTATAKITVKAPVTTPTETVPETPTETEPETTVTTVETPKSTVATLRNLGITPNDFYGFKSGTLNYTAEVPYDTSKVSLYAYATDSNATVSGTGSKSLSVGDNKFEIVVTAEDGKTTKTYTLVVKRLTEEETNAKNQVTEPEKTDLTLESLEISGVTLTPSFNAGTYIYSAKLTKDEDELEVTAKAVDESVKVEIDGNTKLKSGENKITVTLTSTSGETAKYTITVTKSVEEEGFGLATLEIKNVKFSPSFDPDVYSYVATITDDLSNLEVTALNTDGTTDGIEVTGNESIEVGENTITILVTDEESGDVLTYQIIVTKELQTEEKTSNNGTNIGKIILAVAAIIIIIALIVLLKPKKNKNAFEEDEQDDNDNFDDDNFNPFLSNNQIEQDSVEFDESQESSLENVDRKNEYNVFEDKDFLENQNNNFDKDFLENQGDNFTSNNFKIEEDVIDADNQDEIERSITNLKGKRKGKHF